MPRKKLRHGEARGSDKNAVFLNIPYDEQFTQLFLAYLVGIRAYGLIPRATIEIPGGARRLDRIASLIRSCTYSVHDLSRVELDPAPPPTPRFKMPFELGLAVAFHWSRSAKHTWFVVETEKWRIQKSLSDLNGTDVYVHGERRKVYSGNWLRHSSGRRASPQSNNCGQFIRRSEVHSPNSWTSPAVTTDSRPVCSRIFPSMRDSLPKSSQCRAEWLCIASKIWRNESKASLWAD